MAGRLKPHYAPPTHSRVGLKANVPREVDEALREIHRHTRLSLSEQVSRALLAFLKNPPQSIEDEEVFDPRLKNIELEEEAILCVAKLKIAEGRRMMKRVEEWRKAQARQQRKERSTTSED